MRLWYADYRLILQTVRFVFARAKVSFFHRMSHRGTYVTCWYVRHSVLGEILVALVIISQDPWQGETGVWKGGWDVVITGFKDLLLFLVGIIS